ncbi:DNA-(apurinic or apyrimidinic site) endonuclease 2 isoform X2 [Populus alba]|uniref:DNA-(apurinic or apyrimidinic site) endonuclease 2 isoform X2 n=1 Tax=Populus alba TaxID=43335 RepID=UPI00158A8D67|nr:DNA-(apurinic or apyrimidinic site) lyase 2 isoform X2 [Populus alba]
MGNPIKIVSYNVNGLRQRVSQFGSLSNLLNTFDADIICFQETKLRRQELSSDLVIADGYESFFSCTRTNDKGRTGYSGVATFCRVKSAFSSSEVALPVAAEEGFTGFIDRCKRKEGLEEFEKDELVKVDSEGRCVVTDHNHFVLFNIYGPRAVHDDTERIEFKMKFFKILQKRWENLLHEGRRVFVVGDLNIAPTAMDRCDADPDFEKNEFRRWFRSMLMLSGGLFVDVFRAKHPDRWKGGWGIKLEGSDHAPVYMSLEEICDIPRHSTPPLSARYLPMIHGVQQTLVTLFMKRQAAKQIQSSRISSSFSDGDATIKVCSESMKRSFNECSESCPSTSPSCSLTEEFDSAISKREENSKDLTDENQGCPDTTMILQSQHTKLVPAEGTKKKPRKSRCSQLSLKSFFQKSPNLSTGAGNSSTNASPSQAEPNTSSYSNGSHAPGDKSSSPRHCQLNPSAGSMYQDKGNDCSLERERNNVALLEWQRIQQLMRNSIPVCKGHKEPCVARIVKKPGPTFGHRFFVCSRAEGPVSNPEANCGYFKWASSKSQRK